ncbi:hypothetical protein [Hoeflea alexandrii]|uniref:hypothetical protein n=1 Tax=Hoeflea alexandrii TaxID=288436 RepID=UPI0022AF1A22|nr:hypothetical protein [Hoeflea alexandrii]MCZ4289621.1 hypothetical protein [Hoeflea alexandrii]
MRSRLIVILGYVVMIFAAPLSQYLCIVWVLGNTTAGFNSIGGPLALLAVLFGWLPGSMLGGAIAAAGASDRRDKSSHFQMVTSLGFLPTLASCAVNTF